MAAKKGKHNLGPVETFEQKQELEEQVLTILRQGRLLTMAEDLKQARQGAFKDIALEEEEARRALGIVLKERKEAEPKEIGEAPSKEAEGLRLLIERKRRLKEELITGLRQKEKVLEQKRASRREQEERLRELAAQTEVGKEVLAKQEEVLDKFKEEEAEAIRMVDLAKRRIREIEESQEEGLKEFEKERAVIPKAPKEAEEEEVRKAWEAEKKAQEEAARLQEEKRKLEEAREKEVERKTEEARRKEEEAKKERREAQRQKEEEAERQKEVMEREEEEIEKAKAEEQEKLAGPSFEELKKKQLEIARKLQGFAGRRRPLEQKSASLEEQKSYLLNKLSALSKEEEIIEAKKKAIEQEEGAAENIRAKRKAERSRWLVETKRKRIEKQKWRLEKDLAKKEKALSLLQKKLDIVLKKENALRKSHQEIKRWLQREGLQKQKQIIESRLKEIQKEEAVLQNRKTKAEERLAEAEEKVSELLKREQAIEEKEAKIEEKEALAKSPAQEAAAEKSRWQIEKERKEIEQQRWRAENRKRIVERQVEAVQKEETRILDEKEALKNQLAEIDQQVLGGPEEEYEEEKKEEEQVLPPAPVKTAAQEEEAALIREKARELETEKEGAKIGEGRIAELIRQRAREEEEKKKLAKVKETARLYRSRAVPELIGPIRKEEILKRLTAVSKEEQEKRRQFLERVAGVKQVSFEPSQPRKGAAKEIVFRPIVKQPSLWERVLVRVLFGFLAAIVLIAGWFLFKKYFSASNSEALNDNLPENNYTENLPAGLSGGEEEIEPVLPAPALFSVSESKVLAFLEQIEILILLSEELAAPLPKGTILRLSFRDGNLNQLAGLRTILSVLEVRLKAGFLEAVEQDSATLAAAFLGLYPDLVLATEISDEEGLKAVMNEWEETMADDFQPLFEIIFPGEVEFTGDFKSAKAGAIDFRYLDSSEPSIGLCYGFSKELFVLTTSGETMLKVAESINQ